MNTIEVNIANLVPYECGALRESYDYAIDQLKRGEELLPPSVAQLDDGTLVVKDGNSRVKAAYDQGQTTLKVRMICVGSEELKACALTASLRAKQALTFRNLPIHDTIEQRDAATVLELSQLGYR